MTSSSYTRSAASVACLAMLSTAAAVVRAGDFTSTLLNGDADSGINSGLVYTAKADYNGTSTINGVAFTDGAASGTGYELTGAAGAFTGYANTATGSLNGALSNFFYTNTPDGNASLTLSGLTPGTAYVTSFYNTSFGGNRYIDITPSDTGSAFRYNQDTNVTGAGSVLRYSFTATAATQTFGFDPLSNGDSFHHYILTNAVRNDSIFSYTHFTPLTPVVTEQTGSNTPFAPSNTDLLQTNLAGIVTTGNLSREGILGTAASLANGTFSISGVGANNPELITGENNSSVTFNLDTSVNTAGYDVTSIASFGGWNDAGRDAQRYSLYFSTVGSEDYTLYGQLDRNPAGGSLSAVQAVFTGLATNVDSVKVIFLDGVENGYVGYGEFDVTGTASIPEPSTGSALLLASLGLLSRRRRK